MLFYFLTNLLFSQLQETPQISQWLEVIWTGYLNGPWILNIQNKHF